MHLLLLFAEAIVAGIVISMATDGQKLPSIVGILRNPIKLLKRRMRAWQFLLYGPDIIQQEYDKAQGKPFVVDVPENRYIFVTSSDHIKEIDAASDDTLSLQAAAKQLLQPQYTMHNFNWFDRRGTDGTPLIRTLRTLLTNNIPKLLPDMQFAISDLFDRLYGECPTIKGKKQSPLYPMVLQTVARVNAMSFFGPGLAHDKAFMKAAVGFIESTLIIAEILRLLPTFMHPFVGRSLARILNSHQQFYAGLIPVAQSRIDEYARKQKGFEVKNHEDCIQWVMENAPRTNPWSAQRIVYELMALWFGSLHIVSTTICFAVHDLCLHPEYVDPLREEAAGPEYEEFLGTGSGLPLLDSFIRESMRTTPTESMSTRRLALQPFKFSDGTKVEKGEWVCTPPRAMMRDAANYDCPLRFDGFRFVDPKRLEALALGAKNSSTEPSKLTDVANWQIWGTGRMSCPGRFYAAAVMKVVLATLITKYDFSLSNPKANRSFGWRSFIYPSFSLALDLRPRAKTATC